MPRRQTPKTTAATDDTERPNTPPPNDDILEKIASIEEEVNQRFEEINEEINNLKKNTEKFLKNECRDDERFLKLCHAVDYLLEHTDSNYETLACREMIYNLLGQRSARPFSGRTIRNRQLCRRMKRWCFFIAFILFTVACMSIYGLHRNWCYLLVIVCLSGSLFSSIGLRRLYKIIDVIW